MDPLTLGVIFIWVGIVSFAAVVSRMMVWCFERVVNGAYQPI